MTSTLIRARISTLTCTYLENQAPLLKIGICWYDWEMLYLSFVFLFSPFLSERINQTVEITKHTVDIEEKGVKLKLTIVDTPGFGDAVNNNEW